MTRRSVLVGDLAARKPSAVDTALEVANELNSAREKFPPFHSAHEGFAVLKEEVDELWDEIKMKGASKARMREEAIQVAAMAIRFVQDVCDQ